MQLSLSPRELEVGRLICQGATSAEIARTLGLAPSTIHAHRASLRIKFRARNTGELIGAMILQKHWRPALT